MNKLRTLTLIESNNLPFVFALNPGENPSKLMLCANLETLVLHIKLWNHFRAKHLTSMVKNRAMRGMRLRSITITGLERLVSGTEMLEFREHVTHAEYRVGNEEPALDDVGSACGCRSPPLGS